MDGRVMIKKLFSKKPATKSSKKATTPPAPKKEPPSPVTEVKKLAAAAYGEASTDDVPDEIAGIAWAIANRARASKKSITKMLVKPGYVYAVTKANIRYKKLINASEKAIAADKGMTLAMESAKNASENNGTDPSNGAYWWDGDDFKTNPNHDKKRRGFCYSDPSHNIFGVEEKRVLVIKTKTITNKKTKKSETTEVGRYDYVYESTAAYGSTIFWKLGQDFLKVSGGRDYN